MRLLTKYTAAPIDSIASSALARKMRLVIEPEHAHHGTTRSTSAQPLGGTTTERVTRASPSYQPTTV